jgi:hypothetical protein
MTAGLSTRASNPGFQIGSPNLDTTHHEDNVKHKEQETKDKKREKDAEGQV